MVGRVVDAKDGAKSKLYVLGRHSGKGFDKLVDKFNPGFDLADAGQYFGASDHFSFYQKKVPVLFFWTGYHPDYHMPSDTADKINVPGMRKVVDGSPCGAIFRCDQQRIWHGVKAFATLRQPAGSRRLLASRRWIYCSGFPGCCKGR